MVDDVLAGSILGLDYHSVKLARAALAKARGEVTNNERKKA
jgi:hypothetical protein